MQEMSLQNLENKVLDLDLQVKELLNFVKVMHQKEQNTENHTTFISSIYEFGINREQAAKIRASFDTCCEDWDEPEMDVYDQKHLEKVREVFEKEEKTAFNKGDIVLALFASTDLTMVKLRPMMVIQNKRTSFDKYIAAMICSRKRTGETSVFVDKNSEENTKMNLLTDSTIYIDNLKSVKNCLLMYKIGESPKEIIEKIDLRIRIVFGLQ